MGHAVCRCPRRGGVDRSSLRLVGRGRAGGPYRRLVTGTTLGGVGTTAHNYLSFIAVAGVRCSCRKTDRCVFGLLSAALGYCVLVSRANLLI